MRESCKGPSASVIIERANHTTTTIHSHARRSSSSPLTACYEGGFALWPTKHSNYSVAASSWRGGKGDVLREFADAANRWGIKICYYLNIQVRGLASRVGQASRVGLASRVGSRLAPRVKVGVGLMDVHAA